MSTKQAWTPGPWAHEPARPFDSLQLADLCERIYATGPGPDRDFTIAFVREADPELRALHASLISKAPEMAELLRECNNYLDSGYDGPGLSSPQIRIEIQRLLADLEAK